MWIEDTKGSDITAYYESHHIETSHHVSLLRKFYVEDAPKTYSPLFSFHENGFFKTLKRRVAKILPADERGPPPEYMRWCYLSLFLWLSAFIASGLSPSFNVALAASVVAGILLHTMFAIGHDFFHQRDSWWRFGVDLTAHSSYEWRISHDLSHHHHANTEIDTEVSAVEPLQYFFTSKPRNNFLVFLYCHIVWVGVGPIYLVARFLRILAGVQKFRLENTLPLFQIAALYWMRGDVGETAALWVLMQGVASYQLLVFSTLVHRTSYAWTEGDSYEEALGRKPNLTRGESNTHSVDVSTGEGGEDPTKCLVDFGEHVMVSTNDYAVDSSLPFSLFAFGLFNYHTLHHLFPAIDMARLRDKRVYQALLETLREFEIPYRAFSTSELFFNSFSGIWRRDYIPISKAK